MNNIDELQNKLSQAQEAEKIKDFFRASFFYRDVLAVAIRQDNSEMIKLCKNKSVEMNKKSIASGKDFKELSFAQELSEDKKKMHEEFINKFLNQGDLKTILRAIGRHSFFFPKVADVQKTANKRMPIAYQIANVATISNDGHTLRGSSNGNYAWFMQTYDLSQRLVMLFYVGRIIYELMENKPNGINLNMKELSEYFSNAGIFDERNLKIILVGLQKYFDRDYISALHILVPQFENVFLKISEKLGIDIVALDQKQGLATRTKILSENYLGSEEFKKAWGEDFCRQIKFVLFEQMGYRIRHKIAHGEIEPTECNFENTALVLYFYLVLLGKISVKSKMEIKNKLNELGLTSDNAIVIGSGILNALKLRESNDIDVVTTLRKYQNLVSDGRFKKEMKRGQEILTNNLLEIMTSWTVMGKTWTFDNLLEHSVIIDGVRYNTVQFLLDAKRSWLADGDFRQKDVGDVKLMESYLKNTQS